MGRRRSKSNPVEGFVAGMQLRRLNLLGEPEKRERSESSPKPNPFVFFRLHLLDNTSSVMKMTGDQTLDQILHHICRQREYDPIAHTFDYGDKTAQQPAEMDKTLDQMVKPTAKILELFVVKRAKKYTSISVKEGDAEVLSYQMIEGKPQINLATPEKIMDLLMDTTKAVGNLD